METEVKDELGKLPELTQDSGRRAVGAAGQEGKGPGGQWRPNEGPTLSVS